MNSFSALTKRYPVFSYDSFNVERDGDGLVIRFDFSIPGLCEFHPSTKLFTHNRQIINDPFSDYARRMIFFLGLAEAVSYWKCACPPVFTINCAPLSVREEEFWKKVWFKGLGEFFFRNGIDASPDSFVKIEAARCGEQPGCRDFRRSQTKLVPIGGGKDSAVTTELLRPFADNLLFFTVNDQPARTDCVRAAGFSAERIFRTVRTIDRELLARNAEGFLNGHTPFSCVVAFLSMYCGYLCGASDVILSNESSANDANISGTQINHQYSKSFEFETDFNNLREHSFAQSARYFSLLRAFNELQIAKQFASLPRYHGVFRSCNAGSRENIWCGSCAKCLFVSIMLSPFLPRERLTEIFGRDLLDCEELTGDFDGLCGFSAVKPFECVGTSREVLAALGMTAQKYAAQGDSLPLLLRRFVKKSAGGACTAQEILGEFNHENLVPREFSGCVERMYKYVSAAH